MTYLELQQELQNLTMDNSSVYAAGGAKNKACIDWAYEQVFLYCMDDEVVRKFAANPTPIQLFASNQTITLPSDFFRMYKVSLFDFASDPGFLYTQEYFDWEIAYNGTNYIMQLSNVGYPTSLWVRYIKNLVPMTTDTSVPTGIPDILQRCISDFALARYFKYHRDTQNYEIALADAQSILSDRLNTYRTFQ